MPRGSRATLVSCVITTCLLLQFSCPVAGTVFLPRLVAIGDLHGDIFACRRVLQAAKITDTVDRWIAGSSTVIQLGDIADRGPHCHHIYELFASLEQQAKKAGGEFTFLIGNHELLNLEGDFRYVHPRVISAFGGVEAYAEAFSSEGIFGSYILQHPVALVREGVVFVHAGILPEFAKFGVDVLNERLSRCFQKSSILVQNGMKRNYSCKSRDDPLWTREIVHEARLGNCSPLKESFRLLSEHEVAAGRPPIRAMIAGHTIQPGGRITKYCGDRLLLVDVGLSHYLKGKNKGHVAYVEFLQDADGALYRKPVPQYPFHMGVRSLSAWLDEEKQLPLGCAAIQRQREQISGIKTPLPPFCTSRVDSYEARKLVFYDLLICLLLLLMVAILVSLFFHHKWKLHGVRRQNLLKKM